MFPHQYRTMAGRPGGTGGLPEPYSQAKSKLELYDLKNDVGEANNILDQHPDIVARLEAAAEKARSELGDKLTKRKGSQIRPADRLGPDDEALPLIDRVAERDSE